uniref:Small ribosomal subunit protein mS33 n=1 Tax=Sus scrofa TaxID=9823 RepID=A0A8D1G5V1_PIG
MRDGFRAPAEVSSLVESPRIGRVNFINQLGGLTEMSSLSEYAVRMSRLSARLFGEVARPTDSKSMKVVKLFSEQPLAKRKETYDWYPNHNTYFALMGTLRFLGLYRDEHQDFRDEQLRLKKLRGKGKPRKGEGKRAMKKK